MSQNDKRPYKNRYTNKIKYMDAGELFEEVFMDPKVEMYTNDIGETKFQNVGWLPIEETEEIRLLYKNE